MGTVGLIGLFGALVTLWLIVGCSHEHSPNFAGNVGGFVRGAALWGTGLALCWYAPTWVKALLAAI